ncbi:chemotaxis-specific protein-glutamate methyltransferase CheB [Haloarcula sp. CBA1130]|uniref:chemotaxis-specific protein-glutamate methyltransferase CheB n=1 Tax=unclassified Haloarcula TaxID=2624677 RepID=UPI001246D352|nr:MULTISPECIES: chemotaxis-specific protein-glutamate methyltransferase CheB [unclassified Haloarcula]KAA9399817.1 chemotaxis-specific protein-glutamate methyltransferase CheB [Haloarcula sp. CBA1129]KAA9401512.1 chemotaxis-specific protein-glutamate methyltransferase CheB [Haloarcula sp. CBA1130]
MADGVRAVVADDSHFMRSVISDILSDGGIDVVAQARDGEEAVSAVIEHQPDVVTMDVEMPVMNGIEATERIMAESPTPVLMLSAHTDENADVTFEALDKGAVDFFTKPGGEVSMEMSRLKDQLVEMVSTVAAVDVGATGKDGGTSSGGTAPTTTGGSATDRSPSGTASTQTTYVSNPTLVIGSSTGGPKMVEQVMENLPIEADLRVLIIQHMPEGFTGRFAERINTRSDYEVREATDGARIGGGEGLVAAGDRHMEVKNYRNGRLRTKLTEDEPVNSVRPAVDVTMRTAAETIDDPLVGLILTGMGEDGADGIRRIKQAGGKTIAQDEATSAVYGMPKRAAETGCVDTVLPIDDIADGIIDTITTEVT